MNTWDAFIATAVHLAIVMIVKQAYTIAVHLENYRVHVIALFQAR